MEKTTEVLGWMKRLPLYVAIFLWLNWALTENLNAQTLKNNNTTYVSISWKETNIIQTRDRILSSVSPQLKDNIMKLRKQVEDPNFNDIYLLHIGDIIGFELTNDKQKVYMLLILLDFDESSPFLQSARDGLSEKRWFISYMKESAFLLRSDISKRNDKIIAEGKKDLARNKEFLKHLEKIDKMFKEILKK